MQTDSVGQRRAVCTHKKAESDYSPSRSPLPSVLDHLYRRFGFTAVIASLIALAYLLRLLLWRFIRVVLQCYHGFARISPSYSRLFFPFVRSWFSQSIAGRPAVALVRSPVASGRTYPTLSPVSAPLRQNRTLIPHSVLSACLPITPTQRYRGGSLALVLALVKSVPFGSRSRSRLQSAKSDYRGRRGYRSRAKSVAAVRPLFGYLYNSNQFSAASGFVVDKVADGRTNDRIRGRGAAQCT